MNTNPPPLGDRLISVCQYQSKAEDILPLLQETLSFLTIIWKRNNCRGDITERTLRVADCFPRRGEPNTPTMLRGYYLLVEWMIKQIERGCVPSRLLFDFIHDFGRLPCSTDFLSKSNKVSRRHTTDVSEMFKDVAQLYLANRTSFGLTNEILATFGLRQCLENRFKTIIGLRDVRPCAKIKTELRFQLLKQFETRMIFAENPHCGFDDVERIYEWTNRSIHDMTSYCCWQVWKAFDCCRFLFTIQSDLDYVVQHGVEAEFNNPYGYIISCPTHDAIGIPVEVIGLMRETITDWIQRRVDQDKKPRQLVWDSPEVHLIGENKETPIKPSCVYLKPNISVESDGAVAVLPENARKSP